MFDREKKGAVSTGILDAVADTVLAYKPKQKQKKNPTRKKAKKK
jgi:hypothetical protein